jgi:hypothetical protein
MLATIRLVVLALVLIFVTAVEAAVDCRGATPLPDDLTLAAPTADVPEDLARFAGVWTGAWRDAKGKERCAPPSLWRKSSPTATRASCTA